MIEEGADKPIAAPAGAVPAADQDRTHVLEPAAETSVLSAPSVLLAIDPGGRVDPGVKLKRFADEVDS